MLYDSTTDSALQSIDLKTLALPALPKVTDTRGYLYIVKDSVFPDHVKVGRTSDPAKRLAAYNSDKPYPTATFLYITEPLKNVVEAERAVLAELYKEIQPTTFRLEWFEVKYQQLILDWLYEAEAHFELIK